MSNLTTIETKRTQRLGGKLGRKFALVILPLVLIPLILMGLLTYFRMRSTLREDALDQMIYAVQGQSTVFLDWASIREQRLFIASQRTNIQNIALEFLVDPEDQEAISSAQDDLKELLSGQSGRLFTETLLLRRFDSLVVSSTNNDHNGLIIQNPSLIQTTEPRTFPIYNDPDLSPETLGLISMTPLRVVGDQPDF
jgi:hypothetical protein